MTSTKLAASIETSHTGGRSVDTNKDLASAERVLQKEKDGITALIDSLDARFITAIDLLSKTSGRVVVTGMGKSGHVARKIAATMASTGTPAFFVHPSEASHGDLGMIQSGDTVIALSNSGESEELADIVAHTKRFEIPLIALTGGVKSTLAKASDVTLCLPSNGEACPMGLAPTTSTTAMMALGDALAVTLLERQGFSPDDFHRLHPGGKLGQRLIKVSDIMHHGKAMPLIEADTLMSESLLVMTAKAFGCVGVVDKEGRLDGIVTDGDLRRNMAKNLLEQKTTDVMTTGVLTISADAVASGAVQIMNENAITTLFVTNEEKKPVGILHIHDCLRAGL
jgi:arabinose-5-phosphate isomerase